jgi:hypothetical protein
VFFTARWITKGFSSQQTARITNADASPAAVGGAAPRKCPRCGFSNAAEASRCPCGYGLNQKARDEERHQAAKTNWIWPKISDEASAKTAVNEAVGAALITTLLTAGLATASVVAGHSIAGFDAWNYVDVLLMGVIGFGLWKSSRVAAVTGLLYWLLSAGVKLADGQRFGIVTLFILLGFIHGVRGTFALAKYRQAVSERTTEIASGVGKSSPKLCPRCGLTNPAESARCDCGHEFAALDPGRASKN